MAHPFRHRPRVLNVLAALWALSRTLIWIPLWLIGLVLFSLGLALSPWGTDMLLEQGESRGWLSYDAVEGAPLDTFHIQGLQFAAGPANVQVADLRLAWAEDCVLSGSLCLDDLSIDGARLVLEEGTPAEANDTPADENGGGTPAIKLPFPVDLRRLSLTDVDIELSDGTHLGWENFQTGAFARDERVELAPTRLTSPYVSSPPTPGEALAPSNESRSDTTHRITASAIDASISAQSPLRTSADTTRAEAEETPLDARDRLTLPEIRLPIGFDIPELTIEDFRLNGPTDYQVERLALTASGEGHRVAIDPLTIESQDAEISLGADIELRDDYPLKARLQGELFLPDIMPELAGETVTLDLNGSLAELDMALATQGPVALQLDGELDALDPGVPFALELRSEQLQWPLDTGEREDESATDSVYLLQGVNLQAKGDLQGYSTSVSMQASGPQFPETQLAMTGTGDLEQFQWLSLILDTERGSLESQGQAGWSEGLDIGAQLRVEDLDPSQFTEAIAGRINGESHLRFAQTDGGGWQLDIPELGLDGELQSLPFTLDAALSGNSDMQWQVDHLDFRQGDNRLTAQGEVANRLDLQGELDIARLDTLSNGLGGSIRGDIVLGGTFDTPQLDLDVQGDSLRFAENRIESLSLNADIRGIDDPQLNADLNASDIVSGSQRLDSVTLGLSGRLSDHRLTLDANADDTMQLSRAEMVLSGGVNADRTRYQGRIDPLSLATRQGDIQLDESIDFAVNLDAGRLQAQPFCLRRETGGHLCLTEPLEASAESGRVVIALDELPMDLLTDSLPEGWSVSGDTQGDVTATWRQGGARWSLDTEVDSHLSLSGVDAYGQPWELPESRLALRSEATQDQADLALDLSLAEAGDMGLDLTIDQPMEVGDLSGTLSLNDIRLTPYQAFVTGMDELEGEISGNVDITGNLETPDMDGMVQLSGLRASGGELPLDVSNGELNIELAGDRGTIGGFIDAEEGRLELDGNAEWPSRDDWQAAIDIDGRDSPLLIDMPEFGRLRVAPDLAIAANPSRLQIRGNVDVPWARLEIGQRPASAVSPSSDEVIISERDDQEARQAANETDDEGADTATSETMADAGMQMDMQIDLSLGPDMLLEAYGLESGLRGNLEVRQSSGPLQLFGDVSLVDGRFSAYGQELLIRRGKVLFSGPPDQPLLDFEAIRDPDVTEDGVIAGLRVSGPAESPQLRVFSEPAMDETRALSYLLRGRAPEDGDADGALTSALIGLSLSRTGSTVGQLGQVFGVDDLALDTTGTGDDSQVVVSGYVFDDLKVSYGVGIFSPIAELTLRYTLWRNLYLEAVSGAAQAVDLVYRFSLGKAPNAP
ncbi:autotransporter assembly complex protein TamB [Aidingimonas halophila]|uniref:Autotransporter secretion inner membrane protein TamB n=1 Tax=Aidingimonas halophila TaxID=574349 RepID=A0A1H3BN58_9GAMM|nr:translocation/assembly module TamB domain-containing protein [Aidingimonas halophila]GHC26861.1 translocation/assembly module TamB [Aidingimonas halophila]SDX43432.1 autotransporter secretion inner membrane protein TamB [Aidingimonas halophila]